MKFNIDLYEYKIAKNIAKKYMKYFKFPVAFDDYESARKYTFDNFQDVKHKIQKFKNKWYIILTLFVFPENIDLSKFSFKEKTADNRTFKNKETAFKEAEDKYFTRIYKINGIY